MNKTVVLLSLCQALLGTGNILLIAMAALIGKGLAPSDALITLPLAMQFVGLMSATIPASLIMGRLGRRRGFYLGNCLGISGAAMCAFALAQHSFVSFCAGSLLLGVGIGFGTLYRFAAVETCNSEQRSRAISYVMLGGILAAFLGPMLAVESRDWVSGVPFMGSFLGLMVLNVVALLLLTQADFAKPVKPSAGDEPARELVEVLRQPVFIVSVVSAAVGYAVMNLLMSATPLAMHHSGFSFADSAWVIQWHVLGMFVPSFFTGKLIARFGSIPMIQLGAFAILLCICVDISGQGLWYYWSGLVLLGVGWNFMFISATHLVTAAYTQAEKAKAQAANEFIIFSCVTVSALSSGWLEATIGWRNMNMAMIAIVVLSILVVWGFSRRIAR
ncbi:MAG: MFS transporter [Pseudomonadales bacterium]